MTTAAMKKLDTAATEEIHAALEGLTGKPSRARALELAERYGVCVQTIYAASRTTRTPRKTRTDKGKRTADLNTDESLKLAAALVVKNKFTAEEALKAIGKKGLPVPCSTATFRRLLRENGIGTQQAKRQRRPHTRFEAEFPGQLAQIDATALKTRWIDVKTRRIFKIAAGEKDRNHPNANPDHLPIWAVGLVDDYSRRWFLRFYAVPRLTQTEMIDFMLAYSREMGLHLTVYSDNAKELVGHRMKRAAKILNHLFRDSGGFQMCQHKPHNSQATGKIENLHKVAENFEKYVSIMPTPSLDVLNRLATVFTTEKNHAVHRETGVAPMVRWRETHNPMRIPPPETMNHLFQARDLTPLVRADVTIEVDGQSWQLPLQSPYLEWAEEGRKLNLLWSETQDTFWVLTEDQPVEVVKVAARPDPVGSYRRIPPTRSQKTRQNLEQVPTKDLITIEELEAHAAKVAAQAPALLPKPKLYANADDLLVALGLSQGKPAGTAEIRQFTPPEPTRHYEAVRTLTRIEAIRHGQETGFLSNPIAPDQKAFIADLFTNRISIDQTEFVAALSAWLQPKAAAQ